MGAPDWPGQMCAICRRVLDERVRYEAGGVSVGVWEHARQDVYAGVDHEPVPVPIETDKLLARCDFCNVEVVARTCWTVPVADFRELSVGNTDHWSRGDFAACIDCAEMVGTGDWRGLLRRVEAAWKARQGGTLQPVVAAFLRHHISSVRLHAKGPPYLESEL